MIFEQPYLLVLTLPAAALLWRFRAGRKTLLICQACIALVLVMVLAKPVIERTGQQRTLMVVADRSDSMPASHEKDQAWVVKRLTELAGPNDRLGLVEFAQSAHINYRPQTTRFAANPWSQHSGRSDLSSALTQAIECIEGGPGKILILSDGQFTDQNPLPQAIRARREGIEIDYQLRTRSHAQDLAILRVESPTDLTPGQFFLINAWISVPKDQRVHYRLTRSGITLAEGDQTLKRGTKRLSFRDHVQETGHRSYQLTITGVDGDDILENNRADFFIGVRSVKPLLWVSHHADPRLLEPLRKAGLEIETEIKTQAPLEWSLGYLSRFSAVVVENVSALDLGHDNLVLLANWIEHSGGGLLMTGGKKAFGMGGYHKSPLDNTLPITMELRQEQRKFGLAIVVALDRSGSMGAPASSGQTKMDLANIATAEVLNLLSPLDEFGVIAVDTMPHIVAPLEPVDANSNVRNQILGIGVGGGGIYVYTALAQAADMLLASTAPARHIILFADASDAEEPGSYFNLLNTCKDAGITVSVVALGTDRDRDAKLLIDIADKGNGYCYFTDSAESLPQIFLQDTFILTQSAFIDQTTALSTLAPFRTLTQSRFDVFPSINGYNVSYLRPNAQMAMVSNDDQAAPVLAYWSVGLGRVICYSGEINGKYSTSLNAWPNFGNWLESMLRWAAGAHSETPDGSVLTQTNQRGDQIVRLHLDPNRKKDPFIANPTVQVLSGVPGAKPHKTSVEMTWINADELEARIPLEGDRTVLSAVDFDGSVKGNLAPTRLPYSPEFNPRPNGHQILKHLAQLSGGQQRAKLDHLWHETTPQRNLIDLRPPLLLFALFLFTFQVFARRIPFRMKRRDPKKEDITNPVEISKTSTQSTLEKLTKKP